MLKLVERIYEWIMKYELGLLLLWKWCLFFLIFDLKIALESMLKLVGLDDDFNVDFMLTFGNFLKIALKSDIRC